MQGALGTSGSSEVEYHEVNAQHGPNPNQSRLVFSTCFARGSIRIQNQETVISKYNVPMTVCICHCVDFDIRDTAIFFSC